jgi:hypothetical protein
VNAACVGRHRLFDSTNRDDHRKARAICAECPVLGWCAQRAEVLKRSRSSGVRPLTGTWAGRLYGRATGRLRRLEPSEEPDLSAAQLRALHAAYVRGERSEMVAIGERIYSRRQKAARRAAVSA